MSSMLKQHLEENKKAILAEWRNIIFNSYPPDSVQFLKTERDQFNNPIGACIKEVTEEIYDGLLANVTIDQLFAALDRIIRIRSVQDYTPSQAIAFMNALKLAIRHNCEDINSDENFKEFLDFEARIDRLTFLAFDIYMQCREKIYEIRVNDMKRQSAMLFQRSQNFEKENEK